MAPCWLSTLERFGARRSGGRDLIELAPGMTLVLALAMGAYTVVLFAIGFWARGRIRDEEDYFVAGRRLSLGLSTATLFATWFGAGTLLAAADEVRAEGVRAAALDPLGAGTCLLLAGLFLAAPLWRLKLVTLPDYFGRRFGPRAERWSAVLMVPGYFGWIAAQYVALGGMLELFFGLDLRLAIVLVALVGTGYTLIGGMWSVTLTDALQVTLLCLGLVGLVGATLAELGGPAAGLARIAAETPASHLRPIPLDGLVPLLGWLSLFCAGALGNLPGQDLLQRVFSARSAVVARRACLIAGVAYLGIGCAPVLLGLAARVLVPEAADRSVLPALAALFLEPWVATVFVVTVMSAVLSTLDSAILAPAAVIAHNLWPSGGASGAGRLRVAHGAVVGVAVASLVVALVGEDAYSLLEGAYEVGLVSLLVPLALGLRGPRGGERSALAAMALGTGTWLLHGLAGWEWFAEPALAGVGVTLPVGLSCAALAAVAYRAAARGADPAAGAGAAGTPS